MMVLKRKFHEKDGDGLEVPIQESKRRIPSSSVVGYGMGWFTENEIVSTIEPLIRRVVQEEVERAITPLLRCSPRSLPDPIETSEGSGLQLRFSNKLSPTIFTSSKVESEDGSPLKIVLFDTRSNSVITSGPLSSVKIEIRVLDGDFGLDEEENWTENEFKASFVKEREGKRPLLTGELNSSLRNGVCYVGEINFTDNSSWIRSRKFRLGARVVQRIQGNIRIREARSEAFKVKDHRGELYRKHHPPSLEDEVWRLEKISKHGASDKRLSTRGIRTVKDFLRLYATNPSLLRNILGDGSDFSNKMWDTIIEHAKQCVINDGKLYTYYQAAQGVSLLFNSIYKVIGASFNGQSYMFLEELTIDEQHLVEKLKLDAYKNVEDFVPTDEHEVALTRPLTRLQAVPSSDTNTCLQQLDFRITHHRQRETQLDFNRPSTSKSYTFEPDNALQFGISNGQCCHPLQMLAPSLRNSFSMGDLITGHCDGGICWSTSGSQGPIVLGNHLLEEDISQVQTSTYFPHSTTTMGEENAFFWGSSGEAVGLFPKLPSFSVQYNPRNAKPKAGWCKLRAAVMWGIILRRAVAEKRRDTRLLSSFGHSFLNY